MLEQIDDNTLEEIARIACGGEGFPVYRRGAARPRLRRRGGWTDVPDYGGDQRRAWLAEQLRTQPPDPGARAAVVCPPADGRESLPPNDPLPAAATAEMLNRILTFEGFQVT